MKAVAAHTAPPRYERMNKLEEAWKVELLLMVASGCLRSVGFEAVKLRLGDNLHYTPDFMVVRADGEIEFHEVKGFWREDARVKIKAAAEQFPMFHFRAVRRIKGKWKGETFS